MMANEQQGRGLVLIDKLTLNNDIKLGKFLNIQVVDVKEGDGHTRKKRRALVAPASGSDGGILASAHPRPPTRPRPLLVAAG
jgi:hypothetical protein